MLIRSNGAIFTAENIVLHVIKVDLETCGFTKLKIISRQLKPGVNRIQHRNKIIQLIFTACDPACDQFY